MPCIKHMGFMIASCISTISGRCKKRVEHPKYETESTKKAEKVTGAKITFMMLFDFFFSHWPIFFVIPILFVLLLNKYRVCLTFWDIDKVFIDALGFCILTLTLNGPVTGVDVDNVGGFHLLYISN